MVLPAAGQDLREWLQQQALRQLEARRSAVAAIQDASAAQARSREVREILRRFLGEMPRARTPLRLRRELAAEHPDYWIERLIYESQPKFYVTANLYVPKGKGPFPAVLQPVGHSPAAKARAFYQTLALGLVKNGFVVLTYDPIGQGERRIFYDPDLRDSRVGGPTIEHQMVGIQNLLAGESVARDMVWDGIRSIDVLRSLGEVDGARIGVAGCSGGGTLTAYLATLDERLRAAAPACYISAWEEQLLGTGPQDAEQQFPDHFKAGLNHGDFAIAFAPRPYLQVNTEEDFFPIAGARRSFEEAKRIYTILGVPERIDWAVGPGGHGMPQIVREAVYGWMNRWLKDGPAESVKEPDFQTEHEETLYCTSTGQVMTSLGGETASSHNIRRYADKQPVRPPLRGVGSVEALRSRIQEQIARLTRYQQPRPSIQAVTGTEERRGGYTVHHLIITAPGGRPVPALLGVPDTPRGKAVLVAFEGGAAESMREGADGDTLARLGHPVLALDVAGYGTTAAKWPGYSAEWFGPDKLVWLAMMTGRPLVGLGIEDILAGVEVLAARNLLGGGCAAFAKGMPGVALLHAAVVETRIREVIVQENLISFRAVASSPVSRRVMTGVVPGVLGNYDLPDLAAALAGKVVHLTGLRTPAGPPALRKEVIAEYAFAIEAFRAAGAEGLLRAGQRRQGESPETAYPSLRQ